MEKKETHKDSFNLKDDMKKGSIDIREFVGKSGRSYLGVWFKDHSFCILQRVWDADPFSFRFIPQKNAKRILLKEFDIEPRPEDKYLTTYQLAEKIKKGYLKSGRQ